MAACTHIPLILINHLYYFLSQSITFGIPVVPLDTLLSVSKQYTLDSEISQTLYIWVWQHRYLLLCLIYPRLDHLHYISAGRMVSLQVPKRTQIQSLRSRHQMQIAVCLELWPPQLLWRPVLRKWGQTEISEYLPLWDNALTRIPTDWYWSTMLLPPFWQFHTWKRRTLGGSAASCTPPLNIAHLDGYILMVSLSQSPSYLQAWCLDPVASVPV